MLFLQILAATKTTSKYIAGLQDPFKDKYMNGKYDYKSIQATFDTMFVNGKIIRIYLFWKNSTRSKIRS